MKIDNTIPQEIENALTIKSEHEKALEKLVDGRVQTNIVPMHTANMRVYDPKSQKSEIKKVIVPELFVYLDPSINNDKKGREEHKIARQHIGYRIAYNNEPVPLAHVYASSGHLCLGNIFVPNYVPEHSPLQPLETLFLHNDRNESHGRPQLKPTMEMKRQIDEILNEENPIPGKKPYNIENENWVKQDTLWNIGSHLLENLNKNDAFSIMEKIFKIIFTKETD